MKERTRQKFLSKCPKFRYKNLLLKFSSNLMRPKARLSKN